MKMDEETKSIVAQTLVAIVQTHGAVIDAVLLNNRTDLSEIAEATYELGGWLAFQVVGMTFNSGLSKKEIETIDALWNPLAYAADDKDRAKEGAVSVSSMGDKL
jgi:hypothetical protein